MFCAKEKAGSIGPAFFVVRPAGRIHSEVKVLYGPDDGNR